MVILVSTNTLWLGSMWFRLVCFCDWAFSPRFLFLILMYIHILGYTLKWSKAKSWFIMKWQTRAVTLRCRLYQDKNTTWFLAFPLFMFGARGTQVIFQCVYIAVRFSKKIDSICWNLYRILLTLLGLILDYQIYRSSRKKKWVCCVYLIKCSKKSFTGTVHLHKPILISIL